MRFHRELIPRLPAMHILVLAVAAKIPTNLSFLIRFLFCNNPNHAITIDPTNPCQMGPTTATNTIHPVTGVPVPMVSTMRNELPIITTSWFFLLSFDSGYFNYKFSLITWFNNVHVNWGVYYHGSQCRSLATHQKIGHKFGCAATGSGSLCNTAK